MRVLGWAGVAALGAFVRRGRVGVPGDRSVASICRSLLTMLRHKMLRWMLSERMHQLLSW